MYSKPSELTKQKSMSCTSVDM